MSKTFEQGQGFTWNEDFSGYEGEGFGVGLNDHGTAINIKHFDADDVKRFKNEHAKFLSKNPDVKIGSWNDTKDGKGLVYLDLVKIVPDELEALRLAQKEQQIAFYDFGSGRVINTQPDIAHEYPIDRDEDDPNPEHLQENYDVNAMRY